MQGNYKPQQYISLKKRFINDSHLLIKKSSGNYNILPPKSARYFNNVTIQHFKILNPQTPFFINPYFLNTQNASDF